jgi:hypothetical protein
LIVDVSEALKFNVIEGLEAEILKSWTLAATCVEDEIAPEVPVTKMVTLPEDKPLTCNVAVAFGFATVRSTLGGFIEELVHAQPD